MSHYSAELAAEAFRLRRLDRKTIPQVANLLDVSPSQVRRLVCAHERVLGTTWPQPACGSWQAGEEVQQRVAQLLEAGFVSREIADLLGYNWGHIRGIVGRIRRFTKVRQDRLSVQRCGKGVCVLLTRPPVRLAGWQPGQGIVWRMEKGRILLSSRVSTVEVEHEEGIDGLVQGVVATLNPFLPVFKEAYQLYVQGEHSVRAIAGQLQISPSRVFVYAEQYAQYFRLPLPPRRAMAAKEGVSHVQTNGLLKIQSPVTRYGWPRGSDVLWRLMKPDLISLERFDPIAVRESLGI